MALAVVDGADDGVVVVDDVATLVTIDAAAAAAADAVMQLLLMHVVPIVVAAAVNGRVTDDAQTVAGIVVVAVELPLLPPKMIRTAVEALLQPLELDDGPLPQIQRQSFPT